MAKKVVRNDEGKVVPEHCSCGGKIGVFIEGEPIYKCTACGKYYGTMPFPKKSLNKENKNMKKKTIKLNEDYQNLQTTQVTNPVGYLVCPKKMLDYIKRKGFNPNLSGNGVIGKGLYFVESNLNPNLSSGEFSKYGNCAIKVRANGTFNAYVSRAFGNQDVFVVPPEQFDSIEILDMIEPGKIQQQKDDMYANYGNRSIGGNNGAIDADDFYDLNMPGSLSMQAMEEPDDHVSTLYRDNGQDPRWASPKGDFTTKRISESQLRNMVAESVKRVLKEEINTFSYQDKEYPELVGKEEYEMMKQFYSVIKTMINKIEQFEGKFPYLSNWNVLSSDREWHNLCKSLNYWNNYLEPFAVKYGWKPTNNLPY